MTGLRHSLELQHAFGTTTEKLEIHRHLHDAFKVKGESSGFTRSLLRNIDSMAVYLLVNLLALSPHDILLLM